MQQTAPATETKPKADAAAEAKTNGNGGNGKSTALTTDPVGALLEKLRPQLQLALPRHLPIDRFLRVALTTIRQNPKLLECDRRSFLAALMTSAQLGLEPDGVLGQGYLVPYKKIVQFIPGYKGYIRLAFNSGEIESFQVMEVRAGDEFEYEYGFDEKLRHVPTADPDAPITHVWLVVKFKGGGKHWAVMRRKEVDRIMLMSSGYQNAEKSWDGKPPKKDSPWHLHYAWMAKKTIIRQNARFLPLSVQKAAAVEDAADAGKLARLEGESIIIEGEAEHVADIGGEQGTPDDAKKPDPKAKLDQFAAQAAAAHDGLKGEAGVNARGEPHRFSRGASEKAAADAEIPAQSGEPKWPAAKTTQPAKS